MKICILTQPLITNYGGLLQAFALQTVLKREGHEVWTEDRRLNPQNIKIYCKEIFKRGLGFIPFQQRFSNAPSITETQMLYVRKNTDLFIKKYITITEPIFSTDKTQLKKYGFDAYIVGSDQVWRPRYSQGIENYFLDFIKGQSVRRIAYAASFGTDLWEFSSRQTRTCAALAKLFDLITVREDSGIALCQEHLGVKAEQVLDPTMLLEKADYEALIKAEKEPQSPGNLFCYILDENQKKQEVIQKVAETCNLNPFKVMPKLPLNTKNVHEHLEDCVFPRVTQWLRAFMDAEIVITDSFHGCVFSIIFNKPFWVIGNKERGLARFNSLLSMFNLQSRLINLHDKMVDWSLPIDWELVNSLKNDLRVKSLYFLNKNL